MADRPRLPVLPSLAILAATAGIRLASAGGIDQHAAYRAPLGSRPWHRPPLLDWITMIAAPERRELVAVASGVLVVYLVGRLAMHHLGPRGALAAMALAALCPPLVTAGSWWDQANLTVPLCAATALALIAQLEGPTRSTLLGLGVLAALLTASDWAGWAPVMAWGIWLAGFPPWWIERSQAYRAAGALGAGFALAVGLYVFMAAQGADPRGALGWSSIPTGLPALQGHFDGIASLLVGRAQHLSVLLRDAIAVITISLVVIGARRARSTDRPWSGVLLVGTAGAFLAALVVHPWIPIAIDKSIWYMTPMVLCLALAAVWRRRVPAAALLAVGLVGCDADADGWTRAQGDCNDDAVSVHPDAPEVWLDGLDNDCDGVIDDSTDYRYLDEQEPNDVTLADCFSPSGQDLGELAAFGLLNRVSGRIDSVVDDSYDEGDLDCFVLRFPEDSGHVRLEIRLEWPDADSDLDFAVQGLWEGEQQGFALADEPGPSPEFAVTTSGFDGGSPLWLWVVGYAGAPTDYSIDLILR